MRSGALPILIAATLAACDAGALPTAAAPDAPPAEQVYHWPTGGNAGFAFLPSTPPPGQVHGPFDPALSPTVEICRVNAAEECGPVLASFGMQSGSYGRRVTVDAPGESYDVTWPTGSTGAGAGQVYRVTVRVGQRVLGFQDVLMVTSFWQLFTTDRSQYLPWVAGWSLGISFRIDQGALGSLVLPADSVTVGVGDGVPVAAQALDLHGQPIQRTITWAAYNESGGAGNVVEVDSGMVIGMRPGTAVLYAWTEDLLTSMHVTVTDTRHAWTEQATPDDQGIRGLWGDSPSRVFAASHVGMLRYDGATWAHEPSVRWRNMHAVTGFPGGDVWAVGDGGTILRHDGTAWSGFRFDGTAVVPLPLGSWDPPARSITLRALWSPAPGHLVAVGDSGTVLYYDGAAWTPMATGEPAALTGVWGSGPSDVYLTTADGRLLRFDGSTLAPVAGVSAPGALNAVWGSSASDVYAVGSGGIVYHFDGASWERIRLPTRADLFTVRGTSASEVYVGGAGAVVYRFDGTKWKPERGAGAQQQVYAFWAVPGAGVLAAGGTGLVSRR